MPGLQFAIPGIALRVPQTSVTGLTLARLCLFLMSSHFFTLVNLFPCSGRVIAESALCVSCCPCLH